jgi:hypothetical protein
LNCDLVAVNGLECIEQPHGINSEVDLERIRSLDDRFDRSRRATVRPNCRGGRLHGHIHGTGSEVLFDHGTRGLQRVLQGGFRKGEQLVRGRGNYAACVGKLALEELQSNQNLLGAERYGPLGYFDHASSVGLERLDEPDEIRRRDGIHDG